MAPTALESRRIPLESARTALTRARKALGAIDLSHRTDRGSNNWAVAPSATRDGHALLANDPHLELSSPALWYAVSMDAKSNGSGTVHIAGVSLPGLPGIVLGQNEDIAWGATVAYLDGTDVYLEALTSAGDAVVFNGTPIPIIQREFAFKLPNGSTETRTFGYVPHHGPIVARMPGGVGISVRWTGQDMDSDLNLLMDLFVARNLSEAKAAIRHSTNVGQNFVVATRGGDVGWFPYNRVPRRPWASASMPSWLPVPGDGSAEWGAWIPYEELPQAENPTTGYLSTANNDMTGALADGDPSNDGLPVFQGVTADGTRHARILERLGETRAHTTDSMLNIQSDVYSLLGRECAPRLIAAVQSSTQALTAEGSLLVDALEAWDFTCPTGLTGKTPNSPKSADPVVATASIGCAAFHVLWPRLEERVFGDELVAAGLNDARPRSAALVIALTQPSEFLYAGDYFDDVTTPAVTETSTQTIVAALNAAGSDLATRLGASADDWRWGRIHTVTLKHPVFSDLSSAYDVGPYANDGGEATVDVAAPNAPHRGDFSHNSGPSMRLVCEAADRVRCNLQLPGGQKFIRQSPNFEDLLARWLNNEPVPLLFDASDIAESDHDVIIIQPTDG